MITPAYAITATERVLPRLALDFTTASLDARVTITRALNTATAVNSSGFIQIVNANLPRFDHDPVTKVCKGLLIEETRQNFLADSSNFAGGSWFASNLSVSSDVVASPDGTTNADKLVESAANAAHLIVPIGLATGAAAHTYSVFLKAAERKWARIYLDANIGLSAFFDLENGVVGTTYNAVTATIQNYGNGWYRCVVSGSSGANPSAQIQTATADNVSTYAGDGTSGIYAYGAQYEAGAFATSYIPTTTTSLTRNADTVSMTGTNFSSWYSNTRGAFWAAFDVLQSTAPAYIYSAYSGATGFSDSFIQYVFANTVDSFVYSGGVSQARLLAGVISANTPAKSARSYANANFAIATNGGSLQTQLSGSLPVGVDRLQIGASPNIGDFLNGHIAKLFWYANMTDAELVAFTK